ncbi:MAG: radical SAM protein [Polyangiaceae bacterium]|nr:radical SAM protein [Polyangiaceae bacterium]
MTELSITERLERREPRVHLSIGPVCNNNCVFCMEEDRDGRYVNNSAMTLERVRWVLEERRGAEEACFTSGEPTLREDLPQMLSMARQLGYRKLSIMTNGRRLSHLPYAAALVKAGLNRVYVSIHGHTQKLHEGLTRTPQSFAQTVAGIESAAKLRRYGVEVHTSTVLTDRNLPHLLEIYRFLRGLGVEQVVFNVMQANGRADTYFEQIFPSYTEIAREFREFLAASGEARPQAFLVDIPLCVTEGIADYHRGFVERYEHYELLSENKLPGLDLERRAPREGKGKGLVLVAREDLDVAMRTKRPECATCRYDRSCEGVWSNYTRRRGWDEMAPVAPREPATSDARAAG